jgi:hypothetical protein
MEDESKQTPIVGRRAKVHGDTRANGRGRKSDQKNAVRRG